MNKILKFDSKTRLDALMDLMRLASYSFSTRNGIAGALDYVSAQGYGDNPFIQIARAKSRVGDGSQTTSISIMLGVAVKNAGSQFTSAVEKTIASLDGTDAAYINQEASYIHKQIGNDGEFQERDWTARFYAMTDTEKSTLKAGDVISITAPGPDVMSTPRLNTETESELDSLEKKHTNVKKIWTEADKATREIETADPEASDSGLLSIKLKDTIVSEVSDRKDGTKPPTQSQPSRYIRTETNDYVFNQKSMNAANASAAGPALFVEFGKQVTFAVRMNEITNYLNRRAELVKQIKNENSHVVPERPEFYKKLINQINEGARRSVNPAEKKQAQLLIDQLSVILEQSYALYGR